MTQARITPTQMALSGIVCLLVLAGAVLPGLALVATLLLAGFAIVRLGGYRWRWAAIAAAVFAFTLLTAPHRFEVRDVGGGSALDRGTSPR